MSSIDSIISSVTRAINRLGKKSEIRRDPVRLMEEAILREAQELVRSDLAECIEASIRDIWSKPMPLTADSKRIRQGKLREVLSIITPHDTPIEEFIRDRAPV